VSPAHLHQAAGARPRREVADIFRAHGVAYRKAHPLPRSHLKVMRAIERCRTVSLGGHIQQCDSCNFQRQAYNSCRNRHCPKCGSLDKARWLEDRKAEFLPVGYFHLVFTLPARTESSRPLQQESRLRHLVQSGLSDLTRVCSYSARRSPRVHLCASHLGSDPARSLPSPLPDSSGRAGVRSFPVDSSSQRVSLSRPRTERCLPWQVP